MGGIREIYGGHPTSGPGKREVRYPQESNNFEAFSNIVHYLIRNPCSSALIHRTKTLTRADIVAQPLVQNDSGVRIKFSAVLVTSPAKCEVHQVPKPALVDMDELSRTAA